MHDAPADSRVRTTGRPALVGIAVAVAAYLAAAALGLPQHGRDLLVRSQAAHGTGHADAGGDGLPAHPAEDAAVAPPPATVIPLPPV